MIFIPCNDVINREMWVGFEKNGRYITELQLGMFCSIQPF